MSAITHTPSLYERAAAEDTLAKFFPRAAHGGATQPAVSSEDDGHLPDVVVLDHLFDQKRRDVRARDP